MKHMEAPSRGHPVHGDPFVTTGVAQPMVVSEPLTAILGSQWRDRPRHVANRTTSAADMIVVVGPRRRKGVRASLPAAINLTGNIDGMCLGHGRPHLSRREHNRLSAIGARIKCRWCA